MAKYAATKAVSVTPFMMRTIYVVLLSVRANDVLEVMEYAREGKTEDAKVFYDLIKR